MKKLGFSVLVLVSLFLIIGIPQVSRSTGVCDNIDLTKHVPIPPYTVVSKKPIQGHNLCEMILKVKNRGMNGYSYVLVYAAKDFVIAGEMFKNHHQVSREEIDEIKSKEFSKTFKQYKPRLERMVAAVYKPNKAGKRYLYFITDPLCSYCEVAKKQLKSLADEYHYTVKLVWFPVHGLKSKEKIASFICNRKTFDDYLNGNYGIETWTEVCPEGRKFVEDSKILVQKLGINGTPTFITDSGDLILGLDTRRIEKLLR